VKDTGCGIKDVICSFVGGVITVGGIEPAPNDIATDGARDSASAFVVVHFSLIASGVRDASWGLVFPTLVEMVGFEVGSVIPELC
jgi:hypothetical protein